MKDITSYDESGYKGKYEYVHDPQHKNKPSGEGWYLTDNGWARGSNKDIGGEHEPSKVIKNESKTIPSQAHCKKIERSSRDVNTFVASGMTHCFSASDEVISQNGNHRKDCKDFDDLIYGFADANKAKVSPILSAMTGYIYHLSPDYRNEGKPIPDYNDDEIKKAKRYIAGEQEILRMTGLVNEDDTITLFRNTDDKQILTQKSKYEIDTPYRGNNIESWSTNPGLKHSDDDKLKKKIMAKVPLSACIASCVGRRERPFMFRDRGECEVMVCGAFVKTVYVVGDSKNGIKEKSVRDDYFGKSQSNMQRFSAQHKNKKASVYASSFDNDKINRIARNIVNG